ncbi:MAG: hypothetical protein HOP08_02005 [Cyclobacteriaceae bacterium]|nr:hypothetical protein [Cyclobacteriaceae bacterium]
MDELKILVWIVIGIVYLFARKRKKDAEAAQPKRRPVESDYETETPPVSKPVTFEDLLREIEGSKKAQRLPEPVPEYVEEEKTDWKPYDYEEEVVEKKKPIEDTNYDYRKHDKIYETYENATKYAFVKPSLEETMKLEDTVVRFNQFKNYQPEPKSRIREEILRDLKDPRSFKKAFILSEILQKRF